MDFWSAVRSNWDQYGPNLLTYGIMTGDWRGAMSGAATGVIGRSVSQWATQQLGAKLGSFAGPVGTLIGFGVGQLLGGLFGSRGAPRLMKSMEMDVIGAHRLAAREGLSKLENEARSVYRHQADRAQRALTNATSSERRLASAQMEKLPAFYEALNQGYGQVMQNVLAAGREHQFRMHQLALEALKQQDLVRLEQEKLRAMRLQALGQMLGSVLGGSGQNRSSS